MSIEASTGVRGGTGLTRTDPSSSFVGMLTDYSELVIDEIKLIISEKRFRRSFRHLLLEYPYREGKGLRPALCLAACEALGGQRHEAINSAVALELFHNAFLIHDDIQDESIMRRGLPTMHEKYGTAIAINIGDALNVLSMTPLLRNLEAVGLHKSLTIFREIEHMARQSVEGQALELEWVKKPSWNISPRAYYLMTSKKTCWYTCIAPIRIGAIVASATDTLLKQITKFGYYLGIAFQIQDDVLNLKGDYELYGKESAGDIWEGKRTLMLIELLRRCNNAEKARLTEILSKPRSLKVGAEVAYVFDLMDKYGCVDSARDVSLWYASKSKSAFDRIARSFDDSPSQGFLSEMVDYVVNREL